MRKARERGFGLLTALLVLAAAVMLLGVLTAQLASLTDESARYARGVRARALAEAGVEAALARLSRDPGAAIAAEYTLDGGTFKVADEPLNGKRVVHSTGELKLAGGVMTCRIEVTVAPRSPTDTSLGIVSRTERTEFRRLP